MGHPRLCETLGKLISLSCLVWFSLLQLTRVTVMAPAPQKCCGDSLENTFSLK